MHLLIDSISSPFAFVFFDGQKSTIFRREMRGKEFDVFLDTLEALAKEVGVPLNNLKSITSVSGPAQFTSIRIVSLTLTTLAKSYKIPLYTLDFFELAELCDTPYPMVVNANRSEVVVKMNPDDTPHLVEKSSLLAGEYFGAAASSDFENAQIRIQSELEYPIGIQTLLKSARPCEVLEPFYLKKPNIT